MQKWLSAHGEQKQNLEITSLLKTTRWVDITSVMICIRGVCTHYPKQWKTSIA